MTISRPYALISQSLRSRGAAIKVLRLSPLAAAAVVLFILATSGGELGAPPALATAPNDNLASAVTIVTPAVSGVVATGNNGGGSTETNEKTSWAANECGGIHPAFTAGNTVWYSWTSPNNSGTVVFDTFGSNFDTTLAVFTGGAFPLTQVGCNDNAFGASVLGLNYSPNIAYRIQLGGKSAASGNFVLSMSTGAAIFVTTTNDENDSTINGFNVSLREAILFATGVRGPGALEAVRVIGSPGVGSSDLIHFDRNVFLPGLIALGSSLPVMSTNNDVVSGKGASVTVDGQNLAFTCFSISGNGN
ncbi:MAG TPA: hypothetical protein VFT91_05815, partial [Dehalococcoidia bacterium]|nr:hypothetical protein [Dehalococcoidia bacterium]